MHNAHHFYFLFLCIFFIFLFWSWFAAANQLCSCIMHNAHHPPVCALKIAPIACTADKKPLTLGWQCQCQGIARVCSDREVYLAGSACTSGGAFGYHDWNWARELAHFSHRANATGEGALEDKLVNLLGFLMINLAGFLMMNVTGLLAAKTHVICAPP